MGVCVCVGVCVGVCVCGCVGVCGGVWCVVSGVSRLGCGCWCGSVGVEGVLCSVYFLLLVLCFFRFFILHVFWSLVHRLKFSISNVF